MEKNNFERFMTAVFILSFVATFVAFFADLFN